jgi:hypothetical protein
MLDHLAVRGRTSGDQQGGECTQRAPGVWLSPALPEPIHQRIDVESDRIGAREAPAAQSRRMLTAASRRYGPWFQMLEEFERARRRGGDKPRNSLPHAAHAEVRNCSAFPHRWFCDGFPKCPPRFDPSRDSQRHGKAEKGRVSRARDWRSMARVSEIRPGSRRIWRRFRMR